MKRCRPDTQSALGQGKGGFHPGSNLSRDNTQARVVSALTLWIALMSCSIAALSWSIDQACKYGTLYSVIRMPRYPMSETGELYVFQRSMYTLNAAVSITLKLRIRSTMRRTEHRTL